MAGTHLLAATMAAVGSCAWLSWWVWSWYDAGQPNGHLPRNFPHAYLAPADNGHAERVRVWRGRVAPEPPVIIEGLTCWPAFQCGNAECPVRVETGSAWVFACGWDPQAPPTDRPVGHCVPCAKAGQDPMEVHFHTTEEGERILERIRATYR